MTMMTATSAFLYSLHLLFTLTPDGFFSFVVIIPSTLYIYYKYQAFSVQFRFLSSDDYQLIKIYWTATSNASFHFHSNYNIGCTIGWQPILTVIDIISIGSHVYERHAFDRSLLFMLARIIVLFAVLFVCLILSLTNHRISSNAQTNIWRKQESQRASKREREKSRESNID